MKTYEEKALSALRRIEKEKKIRRKRKKEVAIGFCLVILVGVGVWQGMGKGLLSGADTGEQGKELDGKEDAGEQGTEIDGNEYSGGTISSAHSGKEETEQNKTYAFYTDPVVLPEEEAGVAADRIGMLVYQGKVYIQGKAYEGEELATVEHLVGEYIGETAYIEPKCNSNMQLEKEKWKKELASIYSGSVYAVNGYSKDFRLCIDVKCGDRRWLQFLENFDMIGFSTGADILEERYHIKGNVAEVTYLPHADWNMGSTNYRELDGITAEQFDAFVNALCESPFEEIENDDIYNSEVQGHLYLNMKDGMQMELRLIEGGYVDCSMPGRFFVKMPGELFDMVLDACQ